MKARDLPRCRWRKETGARSTCTARGAEAAGTTNNTSASPATSSPANHLRASELDKKATPVPMITITTPQAIAACAYGCLPNPGPKVVSKRPS